MTTMNFVLPMTKDDLLNCNSPEDRYSVSTLHKEREIYNKLRDVKRALDTGSGGDYLIFDHFDVLFSALFHFHRVDDATREKSWVLILRACGDFKQHLDKLFKEPEIPENIRSRSLNALKMLVYLLTQFIVNFETLLDKKTSKEEKKLSKPKAGAKNKSKAPGSTNPVNLEFTWEGEALDAILCIHHMLLLPVNKLWSTPLVEEQFVNMVGNCCYKLLDDPDIHLVKLKTMREAIFDILGLLISKHCHTPVFIDTIVNMLKSCDTLSVVLAKAVVTLVSKYHLAGLVRGIVNAIIQHGVDDFSTESGAARSYSEFLLNLAMGDASIMRPSFNILLPLLAQDPYQLRNCVLGVISEVLIQDIRVGNLEADQERMEFRDEVYENLEEHLHDSVAFVRSKVLQIWTKLLEAEAVPMGRHFQVLKLVIERLEDKSAAVRKYALQLLTQFLIKHRYVIMKGVDEVKNNLLEERIKLSKMQAKTRPRSLDEECNKVWTDMKDQLIEHLATILAAGPASDTVDLTDASEVLSCVESCRLHLRAGEYREACAALARVESHEESPHSTAGLPIPVRMELYVAVLARLMATREPSRMNESLSQDMPATPGASQITPDTDPALVNPFTYVNVSDEVVVRTKQTVEFFQASLKVGQQLSLAMPLVKDLLYSSVTTDVLEAVDFITIAHQYAPESSRDCVNEMLNLIWSPDESIRNTVAQAFCNLYLLPDDPPSSKRAMTRVDNMTRLVQNTTLTTPQRAGLDRLILKWVEKDYIDNATLLNLWDRYNMRGDTTEGESLGAATLLAKVLRCEKKSAMLKSNIDSLVRVGFGERGVRDYRLVFYTCQALANLSPTKHTSEVTFNRLKKDHLMFTSLCQILVSGLTNMEDNQYIPMATEAISLIFKLSQYPDQTCEALLKDLLQVWSTEHDAVYGKNAGKNQNESLEKRKCSLPIVLARLIQCIGHAGLMLFHYIDKDVYVEITKKEAEKTQMETDRKREAEKTRRRSASHIARQSENFEQASDDELEGAVAQDESAEMIKSLCDKELLAPTNLLGVLSKLIQYVVTHPEIYADTNLQTSATLAFGKLLALSPSFANQNLQCLLSFTLQSESPEIRSNGVLMLRDLTFRYPTMLEPETKHLYTRLRDESRLVRANAMTALSSLILTEMVKAKANISQLARCIVDDDEDMVQRAKELFQMMSQKGNQLYNALPDIISKLSNPEEAVPEENFKAIMKHIMGLIQKDRQHELLVEKLCARFKLSDNERQWRDLAFCLSLLTYNERSLRKLLDNMPNYADKLQHEQVFKYFQSISEQTAKQVKPEFTLLLEELEHRLKECSETGVDNIAFRGVPKSAKKPSKGQARNRRGGGRGGGRNRANRSTTEEEDSSSDDAPSKPPAKAPAKTPSKAPAKSTTKTPARGAGRKKPARKLIESDESSSGEE